MAKLTGIEASEAAQIVGKSYNKHLNISVYYTCAKVIMVLTGLQGIGVNSQVDTDLPRSLLISFGVPIPSRSD